MALLEFTYDGSQKAIVASENCVVRYTLVGGGGGGGGPDTYAGCTGLAGKVISGVISLNKGQTIYCSVGQGGRGGGGQGSGKAGGAGGKGLSGFSGGTGGNSGSWGSSGAGGGGGAATVLSHDMNGATPIAIAAGGGAGGGGGDHGGAPLYSTEPYGDTQTYALRYYSNGSTNGAWSSLLNTYSVWDGNGTYTWELYFPTSGYYTFNMSADNTGAIYIDNTLVLETTGGESSRYGSVYTVGQYVYAGWHVIKMTGENWGGPAAIGATISYQGGSIIWTTRSANNPLSSTINAGRGGHGINYYGDGGGAGGGGGGSRGGRGGSTRRGDVGGWSGSTGYSFTSSTSTNIGSPSSYGAAGIAYSRPTGGYPGGDGYAVFEATHTDININSTGWKKASAVYLKKSFNFFGYNVGYWEKIPAAYVRSNGVWKEVYGNMDLTYYTTSATYDATSGPYPG